MLLISQINLKKSSQLTNLEDTTIYYQKQSPRGALRKRCSENMRQIYLRTPMLKCDLNKVFFEIY